MNLRRPIVASAVIIGLMLAVGAYGWTQLPADAQVPIHWGPSGEVDGYADKTLGLFLLPLTAIGITALFWIIPRVEPRRANLQRSGKAFGAIWIATLLLLGVLQVMTVAVALGAVIDVTQATMVGTGALFVVLGNYLPKVRPNYLVGIRTPWTLSSDLSWTRTHRLGGWLFVISGLILAGLGLVGIAPEYLLVVLLGGITILLVVVFAYSYRVWKLDPDRRHA